MDSDMLVRFDMADLLMEILQQREKSVLVCPHDYQPKMGEKFLGQQQTAYPRKNWTSFMVFNAAKCSVLTPDYVNTATGLDLHRLNWMWDRNIGFLPLDFNWLVGEYEPNPGARVLHYTRGGPWFPEFWDCDQAEVWRQEFGSKIAVPV